MTIALRLPRATPSMANGQLWGRTVVRCMSTSRPRTRTYADALRLLDTLQPNTAVTKQFSQNPTTASSSPSPRTALNAQALPEMRAWLSRAGYSPSNLAQLRCIHVAGTKGKGSTCSYASSVLRHYFSQHPSLRSASDPRTEGQATAGVVGSKGRRVGMYTSPHLISVRERIRIDGEMIPQALFTRYFFELWDTLSTSSSKSQTKDLLGAATHPFYFRFLTLLALHIFLRENIRDVVLECGIGGEYDATNILPSESVSAAVVTHLGIDHVGMLGGTVGEIAWHKAGIFKKSGVAFTTGSQDPSAMTVLRERAVERGAELVVLNEEDGWDLDGQEGFMRENRALGVAAALCHIRGYHGPVEKDDIGWIRGALRDTQLEGRCQVIHQGSVSWYLDGAHTQESLRLVAKWFSEKVRSASCRRVLVFNQQDRDAPALLESLVKAYAPQTFDLAVFTRNECRTEGVDSPDVSVQTSLARRMGDISPGTKTAVFDDLQKALKEARGVGGSGVEVEVLVTGSLYLVGGVLKAIQESAP